MSLTGEITNALFKQYDKHKYMLANSYVYKWESDFFSQLASGYHQEIEIKVSRSDFIADFKKWEKHLVLERKASGRGMICIPGKTRYKVRYQETKIKIEEDENGRRRRVYDENRKLVFEPTGEIKTLITYSDSVMNEVDRKECYSDVKFRDPHCPNRFWYCCPTGLIKPEEVPEYAGLMYYENRKFTKIKKAPLIHKEKRNLDKILLDKFYFKYLYSR